MATNNDVERARALIASLLSDEGRTLEEAEAARKQAIRLMAKHGLTEADIRASRPNMGKAGVKIGRHDWILFKYTAFSICQLTGAKLFSQPLPTSAGKRSDRKLITIAGFQSDVEWAFWLMEHLIAAVKQSAQGATTDRQRSDGTLGFATAVNRRLRQLVRELETQRAVDPEMSLGTEVVELKEAAIEEFIQELFKGLINKSKAKARGLQDVEAFLKGQDDGTKVSLGRPVTAEETTSVKLLS